MKALNEVISEIRKTLQEAQREGYGREQLSPKEEAEIDSFIEERVDEIVSVWIKVQVGKALGVEDWLRAAQEGE